MKEVVASNFDSLISRFGSQEALASVINIDGIDQRRISDIRLGRRRLSDEYLRAVEKKCLIPAGWLDRYHINGKGFVHVRKYRSLSEEARNEFDKLSLYMVDSEKKHENK